MYNKKGEQCKNNVSIKVNTDHRFCHLHQNCKNEIVKETLIKSFTGIQEIDLEFLKHVDLGSLFNIMLTNKKLKELAKMALSTVINNYIIKNKKSGNRYGELVDVAYSLYKNDNWDLLKLLLEKTKNIKLRDEDMSDGLYERLLLHKVYADEKQN